MASGSHPNRYRNNSALCYYHAVSPGPGWLYSQYAKDYEGINPPPIFEKKPG